MPVAVSSTSLLRCEPATCDYHIDERELDTPALPHVQVCLGARLSRRCFHHFTAALGVAALRLFGVAALRTFAKTGTGRSGERAQLCWPVDGADDSQSLTCPLARAAAPPPNPGYGN